MKYKTSTDKVIIDHIAAAPDGEAIVHVFPNNPLFGLVVGVVTSCNKARRLITLQRPDGSKHTFSFDQVVIPKAEG